MKIEIGKTYEARNGAEVKIERKRDGGYCFPFVGVVKNGPVEFFTEDGAHGWYEGQADLDLIREIPDK